MLIFISERKLYLTHFSLNYLLNSAGQKQSINPAALVLMRYQYFGINPKDIWVDPPTSNPKSECTITPQITVY